MSGKADSNNKLLKDGNESLPKKRKLSSNSDAKEHIGPAGTSLIDSLNLGSRRPVELIPDSSTNTSLKEQASSLITDLKERTYEFIGPKGRSGFDLYGINEINCNKIPFELQGIISGFGYIKSENCCESEPSKNSEKRLKHLLSRRNISFDTATSNDLTKVEETGSNQEDSTALSSSSQRRSQRAIKRKKFDDEVVSTEPGVISATAAAAAASTVTNMETDELTTKEDSEEALQVPSMVENAESSSSIPSNLPSTEPNIATPPHTKKTPEEMPASPVTASDLNLIANLGRNSPLATDGSPSSPSVSFANTSTKTTFDHAAALRSIGKGVGKNLRSRTASMNLTDAELAKIKKSKAAANKKLKKPNKRDAAFKDLGRWKPTDDLALITSVLQTNDLHEVHRGIKFSCHFTYSEVQTRWQALMFKSTISKLALQAIKNLHPEVVLSIQRRALLSAQERDLLGTIKSNTSPPPTLGDFANLLAKHPTQFHHARTPRCLQHHWQGLKQYTLLPDQSVQPYVSRDNHILNFLDAEASINESIEASNSIGMTNTSSIATANVSGQLAPGGHDLSLSNSKDEVLLDLELAAADRKAIKEIRHLEADIQKWQILVDKVRGDNPPDFDNQTLAVLRGRLVRYLMRSKEITLGRTAKGQKVDVDLKLEGPAWKISRRQGVIKLKNSGEFYIANEGKRSIFVDGKPIRRGCRVRLNNNSVLEIACLKFVFLINQDLIEAIRQEANKMYQNS